MNLFEVFKTVANMLSDLYDFCYNLIYYDVGLEWFGSSLYVWELLGYFAGAGIVTYITIKLISIFLE